MAALRLGDRQTSGTDSHAPHPVGNTAQSRIVLPWLSRKRWLVARTAQVLLAAMALVALQHVISHLSSGLRGSPSVPPITVLQPVQTNTGLIRLKTRILPQHPRPTNSQHASTLVEAAPGHVIAAWFGGKWERKNGTSIWMSHFEYTPPMPEGGKWGSPYMVAKDKDGGPLWNPVLFKEASTGQITLFYKSGKTERHWVGWRKVSKDGGRTWGRAKKMGQGLLGPAKNKPIQLLDGTILSPASNESNPGSPKWTAHVEISKDHGQSWTKGPSVPFQGDIIQGSLFAGKDGNVRMLLRLRDSVVVNKQYVNGRIVMATSDAHGEKWHSAVRTGLPNPNSGIDAVMLRDGRLLLVYNPTTDWGGTRGPSRAVLCLAISETDGSTWKHVTCLEEVTSSPDGKHWPTYSYPAIIETNDGLVHISYTFTERVTIKPNQGRENIMHVVIDARAILN